MKINHSASRIQYLQMLKIKSHIIIFTFCYFLFFLTILTSEADTHNRTALIIGNSNYNFAPLKNPVNDAKDMASVLSKCGFDIIECINCNKSEIRQAIRNFDDKLRHNGGVGLFYYAGHGIQVNGENYIIPINTNILREYEVRDECVSLSTLLGALEIAGNDLNIIILDACRNNPFKRSFRSAQKGLAKMDAPVGTFIAYSTSPGSVAEDGTGRNGLYTSTLLKHILGEGIQIEDVFKKTRKDVMALTGSKQIPWESTSLTGTFVFKGGISFQGSIKLQPQHNEKPATAPTHRFYQTGADFEYTQIDNRFTVKENRLVFDSFLNKHWLIVESNQTFAWEEAQKYCENNLKKEFRLPTQKELTTLITRERKSGQWGKINSNFFTINNRTKKYWTSSRSKKWWIERSYWYIDFEKGEAGKMLGSNYCGIIAIGK